MSKIINSKPKIVELSGNREIFGEVVVITSRELGAEQANMVIVTLWGPDALHCHKKAEETYICLEGRGEIFVDGEICLLVPGTRVIISPGTIHAARPKDPYMKVVFYCLSSPPFDPSDSYEDERGRKW